MMLKFQHVPAVPWHFLGGRMIRVTRAVLVAATVSASTPGVAPAQQLGRADVLQDIDTLRARLGKYSAYRSLNAYSYERALDSLRRSIGDSIALVDFWRSMQAIIGRLQDSHSNVLLPRGMSAPTVGGDLPFALALVDSAVIALAACRCALLARDFPRVVSIDEIGIDSLMRIAGVRFAGQSPQRFRYRALAALEPIESVLHLAGVTARGAVTVRLAGRGRDTIFTMATRPRAQEAAVTKFASAELRGPIAYLRIPDMFARGDSIGDAGYQMVCAAVESETFRRAPALVIDVRGNDGGTRDILELILPRLIREPLVYNIALVRADTSGVGQRGLWTPDDERLPGDVQETLRAALARFEPRWQAPAGEFLPQRFAAIMLPADSSRNMSHKPVVVLLDAGSFSATDIFLGAVSLAPNVTLMGTPSAGGSGRSRAFVLPRSRLIVILSTMASFRPNGQFYDGVGIHPDVLVPQTVEGLAAGQDTQLAEAIRYLTAKLGAKP
jgi:Peptidase family S41